MPFILYAEDDARRARKDIANFEANGFDYVWAKNRKDAYDFYKDHSPDIAILDVMMPDADDGFWVAKKIRGKDWHIPILFLSSILDEDIIKKGYEAGGNDFIRKSYVYDTELIAKINSAIQNKPVNDEKKQKVVITPDTYVDFRDNRLVSCGQTEKLTRPECHLLQLLYRRKNIPQNRESIMLQVWKDDPNNVIYMNKAVTKLRKTMSKDKRITLCYIRNESITLSVNKSPIKSNSYL